MGKKKQDSSLGKAVIRKRFGGGKKTGKDSHVSERNKDLVTACFVRPAILPSVLIV